MSSDTRTQWGFAEIGTARLYLQSWGTAGAPVLLCLHGLGGGTHFFGPLGAHLAAQCRTVAIDLPGSGLSPKLESGSLPAFSFDAVANLLVTVARTEHARAPAVCLLGHSMGAILALEMIRRSPDLAGGLIIVGGLPEAPPPARKRISDRIATIRERGIATVTSDVVAANFSRRSQAERPELTARFATLFAGQDAGTYTDTASALAAWTARELPPLDRLSCLAVTGEEDRYAPPDAIRAFARTLPAPTAVEIMRDCGHLPFLERPAAFAAIVSAFLRDRCAGFG
jgi:pimeloyl-ACP methyl ester carboxylesterase